MRWAWTRLACLACTLLFTGCERTPAPSATSQTGESDAHSPSASTKTAAPDSTRPAADLSANEILKRLLATYRQAKTYRDQAVVRLSFRQNNQPLSQEQPNAVAFERPDKLSLTAFQATLKSDGKELKAKIEDAESKNVDGQIVVRPAPKPLKLADLARDDLLYETISSRLRRQPVQLELLLEAGGLIAAFDGDVACRRLSDKDHGGALCYRVEVPSPGGPFVFWVDHKNFLLRRLDYPAAALVPDLANDPSVSQLELFADLRGAAIGEKIEPSQFAMDVPPNAKQVKAFARPPQPLPTDLFGQKPATFHFTCLDGRRFSDDELVGKTTVLAWYHDNPACEATLQQVSLAAERLAKADGVAIYAVATDPTSLTNDALQRRLAEWKVQLPILRDLEAFGDKSFHIELQPTIVVLDKRGCVQIFQSGGSPELADQLVAIVERLQRGDDLAGGIVTEHRREREKYDQLLARGGPEPGELVEIPEAVIRQRSEPAKIQIKPLWMCELENAGNIVVAAAANAPSNLFVLSGGRTAVEIAADGKLAAKYPLPIPEQAAITYVRTAVDKGGQRFFVGSSPLAPQFFLFDEQWKLVLAYPPPDQAPLAVADLNLVDLDDDGNLEILVAGAGGAGVVSISPRGELRWRNAKTPNALSLAVTTPDDVGSRSIFATGDEKGAVARINRYGNEESPTTVGTWQIMRIFGGQFPGQGPAPLLGLAANAKNEPFVVGLSNELSEKWNYPLPLGVHQVPIEPVTSSQVLPNYTGEWWIAGPDGSVHLITANGQLFDSFFTGTPLTGLAAATLNEKPTLIAASPHGLTAWELQPPPNRPTTRER